VAADRQAAPPPGREEIEAELAWERQWGPRAAIAAALAAILPLGGAIAGGVLARDVQPEEGAQLLFVESHAGELLGIAVGLAIGALVTAGPLLYLYRVTRFRRRELPPVAAVMSVVGPLALAVAQIGQQLVLNDRAHTFVTTGDQTYLEAKKLLEGGAIGTMRYLGLAGSLALGFALVLVSLNAMRAGLLTRFMGILGILVGVLLVVPLLSPLPVVQAFWLGALAYLFLGRWPRGVPPAWGSGRAEPWPSQQQLREQRERAKETKRQATEPDAAEPDLSSSDQPSASRRKRKKRR